MGHTVIAPEGQPTIEFSRAFDAAAAAVFAAHTDPQQVARWVGPRGTSVTIRAFDARTGGAWSYVVTAPDGGAWAFHGCFHEVSAPRRLVQTWEYDDEPGHPCMEVLTFTDLGDGRSRVDGRTVCLTVAARDELLKDFEPARGEDFERLDELLR